MTSSERQGHYIADDGDRHAKVLSSIVGGAKESCILLLLLAPALLTGCVYFNTYYNAQKHFRQAERIRKELEDQYQSVAGSRTDRRLTPVLNRQRRRGEKDPNQLYDRAAHKASKVLEEYRDSDLVDDAMFLLGRAFYWQGHYRDAARSFRDLETNFPESEYFTRAQYWRGLCFEAQGIYSEAGRVYRNLLTVTDITVAAQSGLRLGEMAFEQKDYATAIQEYRTILEAFPKTDTRAELWLRLGQAAMALEDSSLLGDASAAFGQVLRESPSDQIEYQARLEHGRLLYLTGQAEGARSTYDLLLKDARFRAFEGGTRLLIGEYYEDQGFTDEALNEFTKVRDDFPQTEASAMALYRTGLVYLSSYNDRSRAQEYLQAVSDERRNSEAAKLAKETLADLEEVDKLLRKIHVADSLDVVEVMSQSNSAQAGKEVVDSQGDSFSSVERDSADDSVDSNAGSRTSPAKGQSKRLREDPREKLDETLLTVAEVYRDRLTMPDSAIYYYTQFTKRFPESHQVPRALYSVAWIHTEMLRAEEGAVTALQQLVDDHPLTEHANAAREQLGYPSAMTAEQQAVAEYHRIETTRLANVGSVDSYLPQLEMLADTYPLTETGAKALWMAARTYENIAGDTTRAESHYERIAEQFPGTEIAALVESRKETREAGLIEKLEREFISLSAGERPGERIVIIAVEPDTADSVLLSRKYLGFALRAHRRGVLETAKEFYELCLEQQQRSPEALFGLGEIAWAGSYFDDAVDYYTEVLAIRQDFIGAYYRLFEIHTQAGREDSSNHYLREILRKDRNDPDVLALRDEFPDQWSAEPQDLELARLEEIELFPPSPEDLFETPKFIIPLREEPMVRRSKLPILPADAEYDSVQVLVDILVSEEGEAAAIEVFSEEEVHGAAAREAARQYVFYPATGKDGQRTEVWVEVAIPFLPAMQAQFTQSAAEYSTSDSLGNYPAKEAGPSAVVATNDFPTPTRAVPVLSTEEFETEGVDSDPGRSEAEE